MTHSPVVKFVGLALLLLFAVGCHPEACKPVGSDWLDGNAINRQPEWIKNLVRPEGSGVTWNGYQLSWAETERGMRRASNIAPTPLIILDARDLTCEDRKRAIELMTKYLNCREGGCGIME